jgi:DNA-binding transcriptional ArsR family regulator
MTGKVIARPLPATRPAAVLGEREAMAMADLFRTLADPTRVRILALLAQGEACVHVICRRLGMRQSTISHQLRLLRVARLVRPRREGREIFYAIDDDHVERLMREGRRHADGATGKP